MVASPVPIFLLSGLPAAGKSTVARALMARFPRGFHLSVDSLRTWVISGYAVATPILSAEATLQFTVARRAAAGIAREYADAGFAVAVDDVLFPETAHTLFDSRSAGHPLHKVLLRPSLAEALRRNAERGTTRPEVEARLAETIRALYERMDPERYSAAGWQVLDTTGMTAEKTVDAILAAVRQDRAGAMTAARDQGTGSIH